MPGENDNLFEQKKDIQLNKQVRIASDHHAGALKQKNRNLYDKSAIRKDNQEIDELLTGNLNAEERFNLEVIKGRNMSSLLVLEEKTTGDSKQMKKVKKSLVAIETAVNEEKLGIPVTVEDVERIIGLYESAILACKEYMLDKDPSYATGKERLSLVRQNMVRLHKEEEAFLTAKELMRSGYLNGEVNQPRALMVQAKIYGLTTGNNLPEGVEARRELPDEDKLKDAGFEASMLYRVFSGKEMPSDLINRLSKSKKEKERNFGHELIMFFANVRSSLSDFRKGKVAAKVFLIGKTILSVQQNAFGQLTIRSGGMELPLDRHTGIIADMLSQDLIRNEELYGKKQADEVIRDVIRDINEAKNGTEKRQILTDFLVKRTRYAVTDFTNFPTTELAYMIRSLFAGKKIYLVDSVPGDDWVLSENDLVFSKDHGALINAMESRELLRSTQEEKNREKVQEKVEVKKKEAKKKDEKKPEEQAKQQEDQAPEWDEREKKIVNLLGDVLFSYDTWTADEKRQDPGKRMQLALAKNAEALSYIIADMFATGDMNLKLVNGMLDKMPLFMMQPKEAETFRKTVTQALTDAALKIKSMVDAKIQEMLGPAPDSFFGAIKYNSMKFLVSTAATAHLMHADKLVQGLEIKDDDGNVTVKLDGMKDLIMSLEGDELSALADAEKSIDQGVAATSDMIQQSVSMYSGELFKEGEKRAEAPLPNPNAPGLTKEERKEKKKELYEEGNRRLTNMVKDSLTSGESGQGLFTKIVFDKYFKSVDTIDQRSMLASMIRNAKPVGKLKDENEKDIEKDEKEARQAYNEKVKAKSIGNYIGGLLKGAGPLFQKMMQGLPLEGLPVELQDAVKDMKSKLSPIPEEIVEAQLYNMVQRSHGQVKKITVVKPLGAASVGQTFLCRLTRADGNEEEVAIKLLKPDVTNRMMREKQLMIRCARDTDIEARRKENEKRAAEGRKLLPEIKKNEKGGMQVTYEGQLERIQEELDLTIEARNVELGKIYDKTEKRNDDKVASMKVNTLIAPTTNSMVLEKAPGETVDALLERVKTETRQLKDLYKIKYVDGMDEDARKYVEDKLRKNNGEAYYNNMTILTEHQNIPTDSEYYAKLQPEVIAEKLTALLAELKMKKKYLDVYARKWTEEGLFEEGFYHGDPHDGNIMISDDKLTVIDFGNCTKLTKEQQGHVTRMMAAASVGDMELFRSGLHSLLKPEFEDLYQQKRDALGKEIKNVFKMGDQRSAGARIMVALLKAQELGLEVPSAVYNFSQGQMRLQNALANMNNQIEETEETLKEFTEIDSESNSFNLAADFMRKPRENYRKMGDFPGYMSQLEHAYGHEAIRYTMDKDELTDLLITQYDGFKGDFVDSLSKQAGKKESILHDFDNLVEARRNLPAEIADMAGQTMTSGFDTAFGSVNKIVDSDLRARILEKVIPNEITDDWVAEIKKEIREKCDRMQTVAESFREVSELRSTVTERKEGKWEPTKEEKEQFEAACRRFIDSYAPAHAEMAEGNKDFMQRFNNWSEPENTDQMRPEIEKYFTTYPEGKEEFFAAYDGYLDAYRKAYGEFYRKEKKFYLRSDEEKTELLKKKKQPNAKEKEDLDKAKQLLKRRYHEVMHARINKRWKISQQAADKKKVDFLDVMSDVLDEKLKKLVWRMGFFRSIGMNFKLKKQNAELKELGLSKD